MGDEVRSSTADTVARGAAWEGEAVLAAVAIMKDAVVASIMEAVVARAARAPVEPATTWFDPCWPLLAGWPAGWPADCVLCTGCVLAVGRGRGADGQLRQAKFLLFCCSCRQTPYR
eukprot:COSAG01_NODE_5122_length_4471_cov_2.591263_4_plen_116_part_00